jgi:diguanylate cyclase (GGDEF)-like protein
VQSAFYDDLTGLPNRALFVDHLHYALELAKRYKERLFAVLFLDIDRFKDINDSLGHMAGDQLLVAIGKKLEIILRPTDSVARLGGDEFVILLDDIRDISDATYVADRIQREISTASLLSEHTAYVTASMGIVLSASGYDDPEDILRDADIAMYRAKGNGRARYEIFDTTMRDRILKRLNLENELRQAIERGDLRVYFQPIVSLSDNQLIGFEALVRWQHHERGIIPPLEFIPLAEETGMIILIDRWVMREACRQMHEWQMIAPQFRSLTINVNLSGRQIAQPDLIETIAQILQETGLEPRCLNLELTESVIMESFENTIGVLSGLRELGVQIQIDDFGIGYSSLNYLSQFPLTALKIDRSFVRLMQRDQTHLKIIQAIVTLSHGLGIDVVAEGVETTSQLDQLKALGCQYIQGALISMPVDSEKARTFLDKPLM